MADLVCFDVFTRDIFNAKHDFGTHTFKVLLTNTLPISSNAVKSDITEISAGNGYSAGGPAVTMTVSTSSGTAKVTASDVTITASGGNIGPWRYAVLYNDTQTSPSKPLLGYMDYNQAITIINGEPFLIDFDQTNGLLVLPKPI